jgi:hypothetical protein
MPNEPDWLRAERDGEDDLAETMFARVMADLPRIEPGADFVHRTAQAAWRARARRRVVTRLAGIAAALVVGVATVGAMFELRALAVSLTVRGAAALSHGFVWLLTSATKGVGWWWIAARIGAAVNRTIAAPWTAAGIAAAEMIALAAIYALGKLVRGESETHE